MTVAVPSAGAGASSYEHVELVIGGASAPWTSRQGQNQAGGAPHEKNVRPLHVFKMHCTPPHSAYAFQN